jgi:hypothetical protein
MRLCEETYPFAFAGIRSFMHLAQYIGCFGSHPFYHVP